MLLPSGDNELTKRNRNRKGLKSKVCMPSSFILRGSLPTVEYLRDGLNGPNVK